MRRLKTALKGVVPSPVVESLRWVRTRTHRFQQERFDRRYRVDTACGVSTRNMGVSEERRRSGTAYQATPRSIFVRMLKSVNLAYEDFIFVDIGSGKGPVILYASSFPFKRIIGIEYSSGLTEIAQANIARYWHPRMKCRSLVAEWADAVDYRLPEDPLVLYLHNPFGEDVMSRVMANLEGSLRERPRDVFLLSYNPTVEESLDTVDWLTRIRTGWNYAIYHTTGSRRQSAGSEE